MQIPEQILELLNMFSFRGNTKLRPEGAVVEYTEEMLLEYIKCAKDPVYFIKKYIYIVHPDKGVIKFDLYDYQEELITAYHENRRIITVQPRQSGKTIVSAAYLLWFIIFNDNKSVAILANKQATADEILGRMRMAYEELPLWLQQGVKTWNKRSIELENGSKAFAAASSSSSIRGKSISILYCLAGENKITVKNKKTGEIKELPIEEFSKLINVRSNSDFIETDEWEILTLEGFKSFDGIRVTENVQTVKVKTTSKEIRCSHTHLFLLEDDSWIQAEDLIIGDILNGGETIVSITVDDVVTVYDPVNVADTSSYLSSGITHHNCDEFAFIPDNQAEEFFTAVYPTLSAGKDTKIFISSTPNGYNLFHKFWAEAEKGVNGFVPIRVWWHQTPGRDQKWYEDQKEVLGELKAAQELDCLWGKSTVTVRNESTGEVSLMTLETLYDKYKYIKEDSKNENMLYISDRMV